MAVEVISEVIVAWLVVEEIVADAQKALHLLKLGEAGVALVVIVVVIVIVVGVEEVEVEEVRVGARLC
jgi:hypothetical protein